MNRLTETKTKELAAITIAAQLRPVALEQYSEQMTDFLMNELYEMTQKYGLDLETACIKSCRDAHLPGTEFCVKIERSSTYQSGLNLPDLY